MCRAAGAVMGAVWIVAAWAWADSAPYTPPEGGDRWQHITVVLEGTDADKDAKGKAILACNTAETQHRIQLAAENLVKEGTYSVWLVRLDADRKKMARQTRIDHRKRALRADVFGKLAFASNLESCPQGKYHQVQIRHHADGMPRNTKDARTVLVGTIP
ncbi:MAG: hypothetical protein ACE5JM_08090 [Armatimonadota bacterium]